VSLVLGYLAAYDKGIFAMERGSAAMEAKVSHVESVYAERRVFEPTKQFVENAYLKSREEYERLYKRSIEDPQNFWAEMAEEYLDWFKKWDGPVEEYSFKDDIYLRYFVGGKLNAAQNCLDRHLNTWRKNKAALIWQAEPLEESKTYTYQELHREVCKFANVLKGLGVKKGEAHPRFPPDDPRASHSHAGLREDRRYSQCGFWGLQCGFLEGQDSGL